jgi:hypothetical protein
MKKEYGKKKERKRYKSKGVSWKEMGKKVSKHLVSNERQRIWPDAKKKKKNERRREIENRNWEQ